MQAKHKYFDIKYKGPIADFKALLKKKMSFDIKDMGNDTLYVKVKTENYEDMMLFLKQMRKDKSNVLKNYRNRLLPPTFIFCSFQKDGQ